MSETLLTALANYGIAGLVIALLYTKLDSLEKTIQELCIEIAKRDH